MMREALYTIGGVSECSISLYEDFECSFDGEFIVMTDGTIIGYCNEFREASHISTIMLFGYLADDNSLVIYFLDIEGIVNSCHSSVKDLNRFDITFSSQWSKNDNRQITLCCKKLHYSKRTVRSILDEVSSKRLPFGHCEWGTLNNPVAVYRKYINRIKNHLSDDGGYIRDNIEEYNECFIDVLNER